MKTTVTGCDNCKKTSENAHDDGWVIVRNGGIEKMTKPSADGSLAKEFGTVGLDFCSWRCFKKFFRGKK